MNQRTVATGQASDFGCYVDGDKVEDTFDWGGVEAESQKSVRPLGTSGCALRIVCELLLFLDLPVCRCISLVKQSQRTDCTAEDVPVQQSGGQMVRFSVPPAATSM